MNSIPHPQQKEHVQWENQHCIQSLFLQQLLVYSQQAKIHTSTPTQTRTGKDTVIYLVCNCIQERNDTWKTTANSNTNDACQSNTENNKENIKTQKDYTQPAKQVQFVKSNQLN
ncbi:hypothetical protein CR513_59125, partial [Mucuna pruriens]